MTPEQFCYWLQGFMETHDHNTTPTSKQWIIINDHLNTVFHKTTPQYIPLSTKPTHNTYPWGSAGGSPPSGNDQIFLC